MKQKLAVAVFLVIALIAGAVIGYQVRQAGEAEAEQIAGNLIRSRVPQVDMFLGADLQPVETAFDDWIYPDSESSGTDSNMSGTFNDMPFEFQTRAEMWTEDDYETVTGHYSVLLRDVLGMGTDDDWSLPPHGSGAANVNGVLSAYAMRDGRNRPVQAGNIGLQAKNCNLHVSITRGDDEDRTHIHLLFSKWSVEQPSE